MYLEDSDNEDEVVVRFKKEAKVTFNEDLNETYYISEEVYLLTPPPLRNLPNKWLETFLKIYF